MDKTQDEIVYILLTGAKIYGPPAISMILQLVGLKPEDGATALQ
jgi:hypothetical protein